MTPQDLWQATLGELEMLLSKANFTTWFRNTNIANYNNEKVVINVPNGFTKEYLAKKYHQTILKALRSITENNNLKEIEYKIEASVQSRPTAPQASINLSTETIIITPENIEVDCSIKESPAFFNNSLENNNNINQSLEKKGVNINISNGYSAKEATNLNPKYTFSTFIVGKNNELAHAAALATTKSPGTVYNPLFIYGGVG